MNPIIARKACVEKARSLIGVKWRHQGRSDWSLDCIGLMIKSVSAGGTTMKDRTNYGREPWMSGLENELEKHFGKKFLLSEAEFGDIALIKWPNTPGPSHVGIIADSKNTKFSIIHSFSSGLCQVCEQDIDKELEDIIVGVYKPWRL